MTVKSDSKSILWSYIFWIFGGLFGAHHFYLRRDRHAFIWWSTFGGLGIGWLFEVFYIAKYVRAYNEELAHLNNIRKMLPLTKPPFSIKRFSSMVLIGTAWGQLLYYALPTNEVLGMNLRVLIIFLPLAVALGVWTVGNIGFEQGSLWWPLAAAYCTYPAFYYIMDDSLWINIMALVSSLAFDTFSKQWRTKPIKKHNVLRRLTVLGVCASIYIALWCSYLYFNGTVTDSDGEEIPVYEAVRNILHSSWWSELKQCLYETYQYTQHYGWYELWKQLLEMSYHFEEQNAYQVLGLGPTSSQQEITAAWRKLSRENHPDKVKDDSLRRDAQEKFMLIQQAYETLSTMKHKRRRKNKLDQTSKVEL